MKPGGGKQKGGDFERKVCRLLTKWITGKEKPEIFWRTPSSGAKATQDHRASHESDHHGDIMAIDEKGFWFTDYFLIECKFYADFDIFLFNDKAFD